MNRIRMENNLPQDIIGHDGDLLWAKGQLPKETPAGWREVIDNLDGKAYQHATGIYVIVSGARENDGKRWMHLSISIRSGRMPTWDDLRKAKEDLLGDRYAVVVLPPRDRYVNIHSAVLHCFACVDGHPLPEFSAVVGGMRTL